METRDEAAAMLGIGGEERTCDPDHVTTLKMSKHPFCIVQMIFNKRGNHALRQLFI